VNDHLLTLVLADDDTDDCIFFKEALDELTYTTHLVTVNDGVALMRLLSERDESLPKAIYLDLNMPLKTGFECLAEIRQTDKLKHVPVIIFSTSFNPDVVKTLRENGATHYIRKPADFSDLKSVISRSLDLLIAGHTQPSEDNFVLNCHR
jgi:CheY-like chemotaxis protein